MSRIHVFTSAAFNYIPKVRILFNSLRRYHPEWVLHLALADELHPEINLSQEPIDHIWPVSDLDIPLWRGWAFCHTIVELATAIKPFLLLKLLQLPDCDKVIYLDPDTVVFSRLDDIVQALDESNIVLTPHQTKPEQALSAVMDNEICSLKHGIYNLGFIAVATGDVGLEFAHWWSDRVYHFCRADIPNGLFTDQRWIDLVPAFFSGVAIMRSSRHNVSTWNLTTRVFSVGPSGDYLVDSEPLGFYHFTGFDSGAHRIMALKNAPGNSAIHALVDWYSAETQKVGQDPLAKVPWAYACYSNDEPITKIQRVFYRERTDLQGVFSDPFVATQYLAWWKDRFEIEVLPTLQSMRKQVRDDTDTVQFPLTAGFRGTEQGFDRSKLGVMFKSSLTNPRSGLQLGRRGWEILKNEGLAGFKRRLQR